MAESKVVLDSSAVIALFRAEPFAADVREVLRLGGARMVTVNAAETVDVLTRVYRWDADRVIGSVEQLVSTVVESIPASLGLATIAGELRARLCHRRTRRLSIADCFVLAVARPGDRIVTTDRILEDAAQAEGYAVLAPG